MNTKKEPNVTLASLCMVQNFSRHSLLVFYIFLFPFFSILFSRDVVNNINARTNNDEIFYKACLFRMTANLAIFRLILTMQNIQKNWLCLSTHNFHICNKKLSCFPIYCFTNLSEKLMYVRIQVICPYLNYRNVNALVLFRPFAQ